MRSLRILSIVAAATALMDATWIAYHLTDLKSELVRNSGVTIDFDPSVRLMHIRIGVALIIAAACLWSKRITGLFISIAALVWVVLEYSSWYFWSLSINRESGVYHSFGLYGANLWNWLVIAIALGLLIGEITILPSMRRRQ